MKFRNWILCRGHRPTNCLWVGVTSKLWKMKKMLCTHFSRWAKHLHHTPIVAWSNQEFWSQSIRPTKISSLRKPALTFINQPKFVTIVSTLPLPELRQQIKILARNANNKFRKSTRLFMGLWKQTLNRLSSLISWKVKRRLTRSQNLANFISKLLKAPI